MKETACGAIVYRESINGIQYLILKHRNDGHWFFPKGKVEDDESKMECAIREIQEETGLENLKFIDDFLIEYHYQFFKQRQVVDKTAFFYLAEAKPADLVSLSEEHEEYFWTGYSKAYNLLTHDKSKNALKEANDFLVQLRHK